MTTSRVAARRNLLPAVLAAAFSVLLLLATPLAVADVYRSPAGTHEVKGDILAAYRTLGGPAGHLGYPVTDELRTPIRTEGRFNYFERGSIYWTPRTGAHEVRGAILGTWASFGWENSALGFPVTDELPTPDGRGRFNYFEGGSIYWTPTTGAHEVRGAILGEWASQGWETSSLGYPLTSERRTPVRTGAFNDFEGGSIYWSPTTGAHSIRRTIHVQYSAIGWENSPLGFPVTDEYPLPGGSAQDFECGVITSTGTGTNWFGTCDPRFGPAPTCTSIWNAFGGPTRRGGPGVYVEYLDLNGDGVACESDPR